MRFMKSPDLRILLGILLSGLLGFGIGYLVLILLHQAGLVFLAPITVLVGSPLLGEVLFFLILTLRRRPH